MNTWRKLIVDAGCDKILACTLTENELDKEFENNSGCQNGKAFTAWDALYVYFPVVYDGAEWVGRAPRDPATLFIATGHVGGQ